MGGGWYERAKGVRAGRPSRRDWWRLCKGEGEQQIFPRREDVIGRYRGQLVEEIIARPELCPGGAPEFVADVADGVDREGQQVQTHQDGGKILLPMSKAVLKVVAVGLEHVERLVLDLPPCPAAGGKLDDRVGTDRQIGDEAVAVCRLPLGIDDLDLEPVDLERILAVTQRHVMQPAVAMHETRLAAPDRLLHRRQVDPAEVFPDQRMRGRFADEEEVPARVQHRLAERLAGEQIRAPSSRSHAWPSPRSSRARSPPRTSGSFWALFGVFIKTVVYETIIKREICIEILAI